MFKKLLDKYRATPIQAKVVFWFTAVGFLQKGISILTTPIFTRILTTQQYGMFSVYTAWSDILVIIITLNLHMSVINNAFMKTGKTKEHIVSSFQGLSVVTALFWVAVYAVFQNQLSDIIGLPDIVIWAMLISFIFTPSYNYWLIYKRYQYDYKSLVIISVIIALLTPIVGLIAIFVAEPAYKGEARIIGKILLLTVVGIIFCIVNWKKDKTFFDRDLWKYALVFNLPLIPHFLSETILNQSDRIMINSFYSTAEAGIYSIAYAAASLVMIFSSAINMSMVPWQYEQIKKEKYSRMASITYYVLFGMEVIISAMIIVAPEIIVVLAGKEYGEAVYLIPTLAASVFFNYLYQTLARVEMYYGKRIYTVIGTFVATIINIILNYILIPRIGYIAAGYTTLFAHIVLCLMHYIFYRKVCKDHIGNVHVYSEKMLLLFSALILTVAAVMTVLYKYFMIRIILIILSAALIIVFRKKIMNIIRSILEKRIV